MPDDLRQDRARHHHLIHKTFEEENRTWRGSISFAFSDPDPAVRRDHYDAALKKLRAIGVHAGPSHQDLELKVRFDPAVVDRVIDIALDEGGAYGSRESVLWQLGEMIDGVREAKQEPGGWANRADP
jgi:hypothetical protein